MQALSIPHELAALTIRLLLIVAVLVPLERVFAARGQKVLRPGFRTDLAYYFFANLLPNLLLAVPLSALAWLLHVAVPSPFYAFMGGLPLSLRLVLALVAGEVGFYWGHRWMHEVPMLWRFHAIHHAAEDMDWLVNTRAHPVDLFLARLSGLIPIYLLGLAQPMGNKADVVPLIVALIGSFWGFFVHANLGWRFGWLETVIATPAFHHWHHTNDSPDVIDKNFSAMLPWIDRLFGTFHVPKGQFPRSYGITAAMPRGFWGQMSYPWSSDRMPQTSPRE